MKTAKQWITSLSLEPHPEGGFYSLFYESSNTIHTNGGPRPSATAIHYLLEKGDFSSWHRIKYDEIWFFHSGAPLTVHQIYPDGRLLSTTLSHKHNISLTVKGGAWFCSELLTTETENTADNQYSLVSCVVTPGFDFEDFEMGSVKALIDLYPQHENIIYRLCREH
jgi:predicted cupin superfamily sugar epimerase